MTTEEPGTEIAGYRIESLIGRGGMAVVYRAEDLRLGRKVALKLLPPQLADSEQFRQRFVRESRLAASLDHPNIVPIYEAGEADGRLFIAMRYVLGKDLKGLLAEGDGQLPVGRTLRLFVQIGDALDSAHRTGLVHRDVKPANVLVVADQEHTRHGHGDHVYLTDFGLTKRTSELSGGLTGTGHFLGTVDYVSPEQIQGRPVGPGTDMYALGCMLFECLTGQLPFRRDDDAALLWAHLVETPPPVTAIRPELPGAVNAVVARAIAKDPDDRYQSCEELLRQLEVALGMPAPVSSPLARPTLEGGGSTGRADSTPDSDWGEPGTVVGDLPGGSRHPSFPSGNHVRFGPGAPDESLPTGDHDPGPDDPEWNEDADRDWDDDAGRDWDDDGGIDRDGGALVEPPKKPAWRRDWRLVALIAAGIVVVVAVAAVLLRSSLLSEDYRTFTSNGTEIPFRLDQPASWGSEVSAASDLVLGPDPGAASDVFFLRGTPEAWANATETVRAAAPEAVWLYVNTPATTPDVSSVQALQDSIAPLLPIGTEFRSPDRKLSVAGAAADEMDAVVSDPQNPQTSLRLLVDVVPTPSGVGGAVLLVFSAPPDTFEDHRSTFERIRDSLEITR
jgi:serine/threonine protein kinase